MLEPLVAYHAGHSAVKDMRRVGVAAFRTDGLRLECERSAGSPQAAGAGWSRFPSRHQKARRITWTCVPTTSTCSAKGRPGPPRCPPSCRICRPGTSPIPAQPGGVRRGAGRWPRDGRQRPARREHHAGGHARRGARLPRPTRPPRRRAASLDGTSRLLARSARNTAVAANARPDGRSIRVAPLVPAMARRRVQQIRWHAVPSPRLRHRSSYAYVYNE